MPRDPELALKLKQAPNARERGKLLGIDYETVAATAWRLRGAVIGVTVIYLVIFLAISWYLLSISTPGTGTLTIEVRPLVIGVGAALAVAAVKLVVSSAAMQILSSSSLPSLRQQLVAVPLNSVVGTVGLLIALLVLPVESHAAAILGFALFCALFGIAGVLSLPFALVINDRNLPRAVKMIQAIPTEFTLLGGKARWLLAGFAIGLLDATGIALIFVAAPIAALLVVPAHAGLAAWVIQRAWTRGLPASMPMAATAALAFFAAGVALN